MAGQNGSKGNPATKRMGNPKLKEKRSRSWARGEKRKAVRRAANDARATANLEKLRELGGAQQSYERVTLYTHWFPSGTVLREVRQRSRFKQESPGTALARTLRAKRAA